MFAKEKARIFWRLHRGKIVFGVLLLLVIITASVFFFSDFSLNVDISNFQNNISNKLQSPGIIGIVGSIIGSFVGGTITFFAAHSSERSRQEARSAVKRKNVIYTPLYDEIAKIKFKFQENEVPPAHNIPDFDAWDRIKKDSRRISVPTYLEDALENLADLLSRYGDYQLEASSDLDETIKIVLDDLFDAETSLAGPGRNHIKGVVSKNLDIDFLLDTLDMERDLTEAEIQRLKSRIIEEGNDLESVIKFKSHISKTEAQVDELIDILSRIINLINSKHEQDKQLY